MSGGPTSEPPLPPQYRADWYPDPTRRFEFRYHNGQDWTGDVSVDGSRFLDQLPRPANTADPEQAVGAFASGWAGSPTQSPARSGKATAALVLGIGSVTTGWVPFVFVLAAVAAVLAFAFGISTLRRLRRNHLVDTRIRGFAMAGVILAPIGLAMCVLGAWLTVLAYREVDKFTNAGNFNLRETSCVVDAGVATYSGTITNLSNDDRDYHLAIEFLRADTSNVLYRTTTDVDGVAPGATMSWTVNEIVSHDDLDCRVGQVSGPLPFNQS
ncbi:MAG: DUF4190 domain-containing protein [Ilumatobacteraceae bacterium]